MWLKVYKPELKWQSSEWCHPGFPRPKKFKQTEYDSNRCLDWKGVLIQRDVPAGQGIQEDVTYLSSSVP